MLPGACGLKSQPALQGLPAAIPERGIAICFAERDQKGLQPGEVMLEDDDCPFLLGGSDVPLGERTADHGDGDHVGRTEDLHPLVSLIADFLREALVAIRLCSRELALDGGKDLRVGAYDAVGL